MKQSIALKNGSKIPKLGMGTWYLGENKKKWSEEITALRMGIDHGISMIDTAEMYGGGLAEQLTGEAIKGYVRRDLFLVSKVYPHNAGKKRIYKSIENTIKRLGRLSGSVSSALAGECATGRNSGCDGRAGKERSYKNLGRI